ncbi:MAG: hypothetical protein LAO06_13015 [Acidobacteriia bacterium]|nr:hypothetical protein [Terriglobia bacterium]
MRKTLLLSVLAPQKLHSTIPPSWFWAIWLGFLGLVVLMLYAKAREARKRREELEQFGMERGLLFSEKPDDALAEKLAPIQLAMARLDYRPRYRNILQGSAGGGEVIVADRTVGSGKSQSTSTVIAFKFATPFPSFMLCPENALWRLADKVGYSDIDFEGAPDFSRRFFLHGRDPAAVRALFKPEVTQAFEQLDSKSNCYVSGSGPWLVVYRSGRLIPVQELRDFLQQAESLANAFRRTQSDGVFR